MLTRRIFLAAIPTFAGFPAAGGPIWVSEDGNDGWSGTLERPLATLQGAISRSETFILCRPGTYAPAVLYGNKKVVLAPYGRVTIFSATRSGLIVNEGGELHIGSGVTLDGIGIVARPSKGRKPTTILSGCSIIRAYGNGLTSLGGISESSDVVIASSQYDGFNYGPDEDGNPNSAIERNCRVEDAGNVDVFGRTNPDGSLRDNLNGSSSHGSSIVRHGGIYKTSLGPDIADTWAPGQISINCGVTTRGSRIGVGYLFAGGDGKPTAYLNDCKSEDQITDVFAETSSRVVCVKSDFHKLRTANDGRVDN